MILDFYIGEEISLSPSATDIGGSSRATDERAVKRRRTDGTTSAVAGGKLPKHYYLGKYVEVCRENQLNS